jgi:Mg-chelatase subunit ChlI
MNPRKATCARSCWTDLLIVEIRGIRDARERVQIMERNIAFEADSVRFREEWMPKEKELSQQIENARMLVDSVSYTRQTCYLLPH